MILIYMRYLYSAGRLICIINTELKKYIPIICATNNRILLIENVTFNMNTRSNRVNSFKKPRTEPNTIMPANQKLSCWDQKETSILKSMLFLSRCVIINDSIFVIGSVEPIRCNKTLIVVYIIINKKILQ